MKQELLLFVEITPGCNRNSNSVLADLRKVGFDVLGKTIFTACDRTFSSFVEVYVLSRSFDFMIPSCELIVPVLQVPKTLSMVEQVPTRRLAAENISGLFSFWCAGKFMPDRLSSLLQRRHCFSIFVMIAGIDVSNTRI